MRHSPWYPGRATVLACSLACTVASLPASAVGAQSGERLSAVDVARAAIATRIAERVDATVRKDVDALLRDAEPVWSAPDGTPITRSQMAEVLRRQWSTIERTVELTVRIDSLRLLGADSAVVFTSQRWQRILRGEDGAPHEVLTTAWMEQSWARRTDGWRGVGAARVLYQAPMRVDGHEPVLVRAQ